jgi:pimeloyl-ACP methyl ester carboxylesterase
MLVENFFDTGEVVLNYVEGPENGPAFVIIPGYLSNWKIFTRIIPSLSKKFQVYSIDLRGRGKSDRASGNYILEDLVSDVTSFLTQIVKKPCILYGQSMGALISIWCTSLLPERVRAIILGDVLPNIDKEIEWAMKEESKKMLSGLKGLCGRPVNELMSLFSNKYPDEELARIIAESYNQCDPEIADYYVEGRLDEFYCGFKEVFFKEIGCPILLVYADVEKGENVMRKEIDRTLTLNPNMQHIMIKGVDHGLGITEGREHLFLGAIKPFLESLK